MMIFNLLTTDNIIEHQLIIYFQPVAQVSSRINTKYTRTYAHSMRDRMFVQMANRNSEVEIQNATTDHRNLATE